MNAPTRHRYFRYLYFHVYSLPLSPKDKDRLGIEAKTGPKLSNSSASEDLARNLSHEHNIIRHLEFSRLSNVASRFCDYMLSQDFVKTKLSIWDVGQAFHQDPAWFLMITLTSKEKIPEFWTVTVHTGIADEENILESEFIACCTTANAVMKYEEKQNDVTIHQVLVRVLSFTQRSVRLLKTNVSRQYRDSFLFANTEHSQAPKIEISLDVLQPLKRYQRNGVVNDKVDEGDQKKDTNEDEDEDEDENEDEFELDEDAARDICQSVFRNE